MIPTRPVTRWHGGKWRLPPWIISHFPPHRVYTEAYGGAASVLIRKPRSFAEIYNDLDGEIVNLFRILRDDAMSSRLRHLLRLTPFAREELNLAYEPTGCIIERARRLLIIGFMGFGSNGHNTSIRTGFRISARRSGTTPAHDWVDWPESMGALIERLRGVTIESKPALDILARHDAPDTLHYVDPPYVHSSRNRGRRSHDYRHEMHDEDHRDLSNALKRLRGMVVLSGYPTRLYDELYPDWHQVRKAALADGARRRTEILWLNDAAHRGLSEI